MNLRPDDHGIEGWEGGGAEPVWAFRRGENCVALVGIRMPVAWSIFPAMCDGITCTLEATAVPRRSNYHSPLLHSAVTPTCTLNQRLSNCGFLTKALASAAPWSAF